MRKANEEISLIHSLSKLLIFALEFKDEIDSSDIYSLAFILEERLEYLQKNMDKV